MRSRVDRGGTPSGRDRLRPTPSQRAYDPPMKLRVLLAAALTAVPLAVAAAPARAASYPLVPAAQHPGAELCLQRRVPHARPPAPRAPRCSCARSTRPRGRDWVSRPTALPARFAYLNGRSGCSSSPTRTAASTDGSRSAGSTTTSTSPPAAASRDDRDPAFVRVARPELHRRRVELGRRHAAHDQPAVRLLPVDVRRRARQRQHRLPSTPAIPVAGVTARAISRPSARSGRCSTASVGDVAVRLQLDRRPGGVPSSQRSRRSSRR